jgi:hypothetical protein
MLPLLALHAIAATRGDGLHPKLLGALRRSSVAAEVDLSRTESDSLSLGSIVEPRLEPADSENAPPPEKETGVPIHMKTIPGEEVATLYPVQPEQHRTVPKA